MPITTEPPPNDPPAGAVKAIVAGNNAGHAWSNRFWLEAVGSPSGSDLDDLADAVFTAYEDNLLDWTNTFNHCTSCTAVYYTGTAQLEGFHSGDEVGLASGSLYPVSAAVVVSWHIPEHYRGGKPRTYLPGAIVTDAGTASSWADDFVASRNTDAASFLADMNAITAGGITSVEFGVYRFFSGGVALDPPTFSAFTSGQVQKRVCSQRRRLGPEF